MTNPGDCQPDGKADVIMIGGGMANTFVAAEGYDMGRSLQDKDRFELARNLMKKQRKWDRT